jgi:hypothetical protein
MRRTRSVVRGFGAGAAGTLRSVDTDVEWKGVATMATGETGFSDVMYDLVSVQYHALKGGHDYGQYVRDAENAGHNDIADFFRSVMEEDSARAAKCHEFLKELSGSGESGPALT